MRTLRDISEGKMCESGARASQTDLIIKHTDRHFNFAKGRFSIGQHCNVVEIPLRF